MYRYRIVDGAELLWTDVRCDSECEQESMRTIPEDLHREATSEVCNTSSTCTGSNYT